MRRILSFLLALFFLFPQVSVNAFASDTAADAYINVEQTYGEPGTSITVDIDIEKNPGIAGITLTVSYDETLTLMGVANGAVFSEFDFTYNRNLTNKCIMMWDSLDGEISQTGTVATLTFSISEGAEIYNDLPINVSYIYGDIYSESEDWTVEIANGNVKVLDYIPGDVFEDKVINTKDVRLLRQYLVMSNDKPINEKAADVNDDGVINSKDTRLIRQYIAGGYGVVLLPHTIRCEHVELTAVVAKDATCTEDGNTAYWICKCGLYFNSENATNEIKLEDTVVAAAHTPGDEPTCTEAQICTVCGKVLEAAKGHTFDENWSYDSEYHWHASTCGHFDEVSEKSLHNLYDDKTCLTCTFKDDTHTINFRNTKSDSYHTTITYSEKEGLILSDIEAPTAKGYTFSGWYTNSVGGDIVDYISKGDTKDYVLYAHWDAIKYQIVYEDAPKNNNPSEYTIEQEVTLSDPEWPGLTFSHWTDESGNVVEQISEGTTGKIVLTAHYKSRENIVIPANTDSSIISLYDNKNEQYYYIYELGTISNILLKEHPPYTHNTPVKHTYTVSGSVTLQESIANTVAKTTGESITKTSEWSESVEWARTHSEQNESGMVWCPEIEVLGVKAKLFEHSDSSIEFDEESLVEASVLCKSDSSTSETSTELSSTVSYSEGYTKNVEKSWEIDPNVVPYGKYTIASVCDAKVFAIVTYDPQKNNYYLDTFTLISNIGDTVLYDPSGYSDVDIIENQGLVFKIPTDKITAAVSSSYYVAYDANGGDGEMLMSSHTTNGNEMLNKNSFTKNGFVFAGWKLEKDSEVVAYTDCAVPENLADSGDIVTLYAQWNWDSYTATWSNPENAAITVTRTSTKNPDATVGKLTSGESVYYGDILSVTYTPATGYSLASNGDTSITVTGDVMGAQIYATAKAISYTVTYNANGGSGSTASSTHVYDESNALTSNGFSRNGYTFLGWSTSSYSTTPTYTNRATVKNLTSVANGNVTLFATWVKTEYIVNKSGTNINMKINGTDYYSLTIYPGMNKTQLKENGYTKFELHFHFKGRATTVFTHHIPRLRIYSYADEILYDRTYNRFEGAWGPWDWRDVYHSIEIDNVQSDGSFRAMWSTSGGNGDDGWCLDEYTITVKAVKQ